MDNILNKNIFDDGALNKLSPDYCPNELILRMQMRRTLVKDTHNNGVLRSTTWIKKSVKKSKENFNFNREIVKLRHNFNQINLKNRLTLKDLGTLKINYDDNKLLTNQFNDAMDANKDEENIFLPEFCENNELEVRNDNGFKLNTKIKAVKHLIFNNDTQKDNGKKMTSKHVKGELLDLNKDINENNEDIFKVSCVHKLPKPKEENEHNINIFKNEDSPVNTDRSIGDLQKILVMMAITSKLNKDEEICNEVKFSNKETIENECYSYNVVEANNIASNTVNDDGFDNILSVTPLRIQITGKEKYLMEKYVEKWKKYVNNKKKYIEQQRQVTLNNFFDKISKKKMDIDQSDDGGNKTKMHLRDYNTYQHRYKFQKHIIALQKAKLEEQNRLIEELKYNKILEASRQSVDAMRDEIRKTYYEVDRQLKPKMKCLSKELKIPDIEEPSLILHCLKVPQFLQRMEKRAREREEKHAMNRERRRQMEEERVRVKQQAELAKAEMDKEEKMRRIKELKEKRKKERIENIRKKQWTERLRALIVMADLHYEKSLKVKYGIAPLRRLVDMKRDNIEKARAHYKFQLKNNVFLNWMWYTEDMWFERNFKAEDFYRKTLMRKVFKGFKMIHYTVILKKQVADDYYDLYVTQFGFRMFCEGLEVIKKEQELKWQKAIIYHNSNLLFKAFTCWRTLPALNALKREQEARKVRWREKVLLVVPDYTPPED